MQGKKNIGSDSPVDRGWKMMHEILDAEMPQRRRRRIPIWWPVGLGLVLVLVIAWQLTSTESVTEVNDLHNETPMQEKVQKPVKSTSVPADIREPSDKQEIISSVEIETQGNLKPSVNIDALSSVQKLKSPDNITLEREKTNQKLSENTMEIADEPSQAGVVARTLANKKTRTNINAVERQSADLNSIDERHAGVEVTPLVNSPVNVVFAPSSGSGKISSESKNNRPLASALTPLALSRFELRAYADAHVVTPSQMRGVEGGLLASFNLSHRWAISAGVGYRHYDNEGLIKNETDSRTASYDVQIPPQLLDTSTYTFSNLDNNLLLSTLSYDTAQLLTERLNYIQVPVTVSYKVTRKLAVDCGVNMGFLVSAPSSADIELVDFANSTTGPGTGQLKLVADSDYLRNDGVLRTFDLAASVGLRFDITNRLGLNAHYNFGMIPYIDRPKEGSRDDYNRSLSVGLSYKIL